MKMRSDAIPVVRQTRRAGFTMIELLVVIAIIAILTSLAVMAIAPAIGGARNAATRTTITQLNRMIQDRLDGFTAMDLRKDLSFFRARTGIDASLTDEQVEPLLRKVLYRAYFPQRKEDIHSDYDRFLPPVHRARVQKFRASLGTEPLILAQENSQLLYAFLTNSENFGFESRTIDEINPRHIVEDDGKPYFVDDWEQPIVFYSAPTQLTNSNGAYADAVNRAIYPQLVEIKKNSQQSKADPFDPRGASLIVRTPIVDSRNFGDEIRSHAFFYDPQTYFGFLVMSGGPDMQLGMHLPTDDGPERLGMVTDPSDPSDVYDNISNRQAQ